MIQTILIFSPLIVVLIVSVVCSIQGFVQLYQLQKMNGDVAGNDRTTVRLIVGCIGLVGSLVGLSAVFVHSRFILLLPLVGGILLFLVGEYLLYRSIASGIKNLFSPWILLFSGLLVALLIPIVLRLHEPYIFFYVCGITIGSFIGQTTLIRYWKRKR